jgi:uncharacterized protein (UPF0264 family)
MTRLLVSVRGPLETEAAVHGGAHIADVEYPASALGTPYPLNVLSVVNRLSQIGRSDVPVSTNIGEKQSSRSMACLAALGVATAGVEYIKCGMAGLNLKEAVYVGDSLVRTVRKWYPGKKIYPVVFPDVDLEHKMYLLTDGPALAAKIGCDGILIDTFKKDAGRSLLDHYSLSQVRRFARDLHSLGKEAWVAGSVTKDQIRQLSQTGVDVICVRGAACEPSKSGIRLGKVTTLRVRGLVSKL